MLSCFDAGARPFPDQVASRVSEAISRLMIRMRRIEAIKPTTKNASPASRICERMEMRTVCRISISISTINS